VTGDVPLAPTFAPLVQEPVCSYAVAWLLARAGEGEPVELAIAGGRGNPETRKWPEAAELLRFWLTGEREIALPGKRLRTTFRRP
jgi:hypothetical protein